jgi:hypothetical protein
MWWSSVIIIVPFFMLASRHYNPNRNMVVWLNKLQTIHEVVDFIKYSCKYKSTEDVTEYLVNLIVSNAHLVKDSSITRLSRLAQLYMDYNDERGYAITLLWSCMVTATQIELLEFA